MDEELNGIDKSCGIFKRLFLNRKKYKNVKNLLFSGTTGTRKY